jgi:hypothetical protein
MGIWMVVLCCAAVVVVKYRMYCFQETKKANTHPKLLNHHEKSKKISFFLNGRWVESGTEGSQSFPWPESRCLHFIPGLWGATTKEELKNNDFPCFGSDA